MSPDHVESAPSSGRAPLAQLEQAFIDQFVRARGYDPRRLSNLPPHDRDALLRDASVYASSKLAEVESRTHFIDALHDGLVDVPRG